jgi:hypothetical protein
LVRALLPSFAVVAASLCPSLGAQEKPAGGQTAAPDFKKLLLLNGSQIFGGKLVLIGDDRFEVVFDADGQVPGGFEGDGIMDTKSPGIQGANKKFLIKEKDVLYPNLCAAGISKPDGSWSVWTSRFPVLGAARLSFEMRLPGLVTSQSGFLTRMEVEGKNSLDVNFFQTIEKKSGGQTVKKRETSHKEFAAHPMKWFPRNRKEGIPVELVREGPKMIVNVDKKEVVTMDKLPEPAGGKIGFGFRKIVFTMQNLKVSGAIDRGWCEKELKELEKAGKLIKKDPNELPPILPPVEGEKKDETGKTE